MPAVTPDASVRVATPQDVAAIVEVQSAAWRAAYGDLLPRDLLDALDAPEALDQWRQAVSAPPSPRHRVLVALAGDRLAGFVAMAPSEDADAEEGADAELTTFCVTPDRTRAGHGSRLVNAAVDHLRDDGFRRVRVWLSAGGPADDDLRRFLVGAGWGPDGAERSLDLYGDGSVVVAQQRLSTVLDDASASP